ncbi:unnamed protein product [Prorocentrum cordatum]|uniref:CCHC-type domain-containing protein n=1 Tax=Prorocentrum cordatum TaxID=2364126 RepID=A0ABN9UA25_9DINO|nr:unnamed protein product [Polarella glacialis]
MIPRRPQLFRASLQVKGYQRAGSQNPCASEAGASDADAAAFLLSRPFEHFAHMSIKQLCHQHLVLAARGFTHLEFRQANLWMAVFQRPSRQTEPNLVEVAYLETFIERCDGNRSAGGRPMKHAESRRLPDPTTRRGEARTALPRGTMSEFAGAGMPMQGEARLLSGLTEKAIRNGFVRKVYGILGAQLVATAVIGRIIMSVGDSLQESTVLFLLFMSLAISVAMMCVFMCRPDMMRKSPSNYICLGLYTLAMGIMVGFISAQYTQESVLIALGITCLVVVGLTAFACQTTYDFTGCGPYLFCACLVLMGFSFTLWIASMAGLHGPAFQTARLVYSAMGAMLFSAVSQLAAGEVAYLETFIERCDSRRLPDPTTRRGEARNALPRGTMSEFAGAGMPMQGEARLLSGLTEKAIRNGFVRKVYGILGAQLVATAVIGRIIMSVGDSLQESTVLFLLFMSLAISVAMMCVFMCRPDMMRKSPSNYICLGLYTLAMGIMVGFISAQYTQESVLIALGITCLVVVGLTAFACQTTYDFTGCGPYLFCACLVLMGFSFTLWIASIAGLHGPAFQTARLVYSAMGAMLFSAVSQLAAGEQKGAEMEQVIQQLQAQVLQLTQQLQAVQQGAAQQGGMADAVAAIRELARAQADRSRPTLVDTRGLGRPKVFSNKEDDFQNWSQKVESFFSGVFPEAERLLEWSADQGGEVELDAVRDEFGELQDDPERRVEQLEAITHQLFTALIQLTEGESLNIVKNSKKNPYEAWRRLQKRFDPATGGRKRNLLRTILNPGRCRIDDLQASIERWENYVSRYEKKVNHAMDDELKLAGFEALVPEELEKHLIMNANRLQTYDQARLEVVTYVEAKTGLRIRDKKPSDNMSTDPDAMDTSALSLNSLKGGKKGPKGGCYNCGGNHFAKDCKKGKTGQSRDSKGKGVWSMGALTLGSLEEWKPEVPKDIGAIEDSKYEWVKMNLDSGAGVTSFPLEFGPESTGNGSLYKTASGECIPDGGPWEFLGYDENGRWRSLKGRLSGVHKVLCSAGKMATNGRQNFYMTADGGWVIPKDSDIGREIDRSIERCVSRYGTDELIPLYLEDQVYNFYMQREISATTVERKKEVVTGGSSSGNGSGRAPERPRRARTIKELKHRELKHKREFELDPEFGENVVPIVAFDYGFMTQEGADTYPILVVRETRFKHAAATCVEAKGVNAYAVAFMVGLIRDLGYRRLILKCDNEPATKALQKKIEESVVGVEILPQGPPEGDHRANGLVEAAVREVKRMCRTIRVAMELKRGERVEDDHPILSWLPRYAAQAISKMRIGTDGKTAEMRRTGRRWRKPLAQFGEKVWFRRIGEDGGSSYASRMTQGRFVGHHDRTGATLCMTGKGVVRGKSWTRQALEDAWDRAGWGDLCGTPWEMLAKETKLEKKVTADKDGKGEPLPNPPGVERAPEVAPRRFYVLTADIEDQQERLQRNQRRRRRRQEEEMNRCALMRKATDALPEKDKKHEECQERRFEYRKRPVLARARDQLREPYLEFLELDMSMRYMQELLNWYRHDEMGDLDLRELGELKEELAALKALDFTEKGTEDEEADLGAVDVMEIFSPPRFTEAARRHGLRPGVAVDLSTCRPSDGVGWDLLRKDDQEELNRIIEKDEPWLLTGSPRCDPFSQLQYLNRLTTDEKVRERRLRDGREGLRVAIEAYNKQYDAGRYFLHEHPATATSWKEQGMEELMSREGVYYAQGPMCRYGLQLPEKYRDESDGVPEYVRKETGFITNSEEIWHELNGKCSNLVGGELHRHTELKGGVAHFAAKYPPKFVSAVLRALRRQLRKDGELNAVDEIAGPVPEIPIEYKEMLEKGGGFWDDVNGGFLPTEKVLAARQEEMDWIHGEKVYDIVPEQEAQEAGVRPLDVLWVDTDKSMDPNEQKVRSRLCVREYKTKKDGKVQRALPAAQLFSAMPPLEAVKILMSKMMTGGVSKSGKRLKLRHYDISRAHFMGKAQRLVYIRLPAEDRQRYGEKMLGRLVKSMYGTQDASHLWQLDYVELCCSSEGGFKRGKHNAALFFNPTADISMAVHGDDFVVLSDDDGLNHVDRLLASKYPSKLMGTVGFDDGDNDSLQLLNRIVRRGRDARGEYLEIEPDPRHAKMILAETGCAESTKAVNTPREKIKDATVLEGIKGKKLVASEVTRYRSVCMRLSYLAQDRLDLVESAKSAAQRMAGPTEFDWQPLKRVARYLAGRPRASIRYRMQAPVDKIEVYVDSDFAGDPISRKSTTGLVAMVGSHPIKGSSTLQSLTSLSVGEAEFYAVVKGAAVALMLRSIYEDFGDNMEARVLSDSTTAGSLADRLGVGQRTKHIQTRFLWVQERVQDKDLKVAYLETFIERCDSRRLPDPTTRRGEARNALPRGTMSEFAGAGMPMQGEARLLSGLTEKAIRNGFVRKVYGILGAQLVATAVIGRIIMSVGDSLQESTVLFLLFMSLAISVAMMCVFMCRPDMMRKSPSNYICLGLYTLAMGIMVGFISAQYTQESVLIALGITCLVVVGLTAFACQTTYDFTGCGPYLFCACLVLMGFSFTLWIASIAGLHGPAFQTARLVYSAMGAMLFSAVSQLAAGEQKGAEMEQVIQQLQAQVLQLTQQLQAVQQGAAQQGGMADAVAAIRELARAQADRSRPTLVDTRGLGRPKVFSNKEDDFQNWSQKVESFFSGVFPEAERLLEWSADQGGEVELDAVRDEFGELQDDPERRVEQLEAITHQLFTALIQLTEGESLNIVKNSKKNPYEAWRRLQKRFDPATGGRKRNLLRTILNPGRCRIDDLQASIERWENYVSRYEKKVNHAMDDELKLAGFEALVPEELEKHLIMNANRLQTYDQARLEVVTYVEAKTGLRIRDKKPSDNMSTDPDAMDTSALSLNSLKGGKKGPKGGCYNCGGNHFAKDCKKGKTGQSRDSKGKGVWSMGALTLGSLEEWKPEVPKDIGAIEDSKYEWVKMNLDSGAGVTSFPLEFGPESTGNGSLYKTASGECIPDGGPWEFLGYDENGRWRSLKGRLSGVHKVLCSAGKMATNGRQNFYMTADGGWVIPKDSDIGREIDRSIERCVSRYGTDELIPLYLEDQVYNFYMQREISATTVERKKEVVTGGSSSGNGSGRAPERP